jgi:hypothetical protein
MLLSCPHGTSWRSGTHLFPEHQHLISLHPSLRAGFIPLGLLFMALLRIGSIKSLFGVASLVRLGEKLGGKEKRPSVSHIDFPISWIWFLHLLAFSQPQGATRRAERARDFRRGSLGIFGYDFLLFKPCTQHVGLCWERVDR